MNLKPTTINSVKTLAAVVIFVVVVFAAVYGLFALGKAISYNVFYRSMVQDTVREMVLRDCLVNK